MGSVTVIIPAYNAARFITATLESIAAQGHSDTEVIVVDDGSKDDTAACVERFGRGVTLLRQANAGESTARNAGLARATGDAVVFLDADDLLAHGMLAAAAGSLERYPAVDVVCGAKRMFGVDGRWSRPMSLGVPGPDVLRAVVRGGTMNPGQYMVRRITLERIGGFDAGMRYGEDWEFMLRLARDCSFIGTDDVYLHKRTHRAMQSLSHDYPDILQQRLAILRHVFGAECEALCRRHLTARVQADWLRSYGFDCAATADWQRAEGYILASLRRFPWQPRLYIWLAANQMRKRATANGREPHAL